MMSPLSTGDKGEEVFAREDLETFVGRLSRDVGCYYHKNRRSYSLQKYSTDQRGQMGVFGWVEKRRTRGSFLVTTYKLGISVNSVPLLVYICLEALPWKGL